MLNNVTIMGRLVRDPEVKQTNGGNAVCNFTLAVDRDLANKETGKRDVDFIDCVGWGHTANFAGKYCTKGSLVCVTGRLQIRDWTDKEGNKRRNAEVNVASIYFADKKADNAERGGNDAPAKKPATVANEDNDAEDPDELPF